MSYTQLLSSLYEFNFCPFIKVKNTPLSNLMKILIDGIDMQGE